MKQKLRGIHGESNMENYTTIVGMEIHVELATASKMFCGCINDPFGATQPNIYTCPTCLGMPGALPVANEKAIEWTIKLGLALGCEIQLYSKFDRKHYFYPDLAKGYQISQYDLPFCRNGMVKTSLGDVRINRVHLEEDTGKLQHGVVEGNKVTLVDFNRSGVPLVEIVTEPDIHSGEHAKEFLKKLHQIIRYLGISGADMEKGSMRLEPNISVRKIDEKALPNYKVEVKNINSFNFVKKAIDFEVKRHRELLDQGKTPVQETRGYVEETSSTISQRSKEGAEDYRYFPDPDIPPIRLTKEYVKTIQQSLPELPDEKKSRFKKEYALNEKESEQIAENKQVADYFESCVSLAQGGQDAIVISPVTIVRKIINQEGKTDLSPKQFIDSLIQQQKEKEIDPDIVAKAIEIVLRDQTKALEDYRKGKTTVLMFLVGMVKRELKGKGDAQIIEQKIKKRLT
jgi:aspartyl-tRNA(Asn)/glutamyl-tRNA(Gln) amidotransferase subunit B